MFPMTMTISNAAQLNAIMAALAIGQLETKAAAPVVIENAKPVVEKVAEKKPDAVAKPEATANIQPTATAAAGAAPEKKAEDSVTFDALKTAFLALVNANREKAKAILAQFGLPTKLSEAKPEQYSAILEAIKAA